jgi:hypothetical protein
MSPSTRQSAAVASWSPEAPDSLGVRCQSIIGPGLLEAGGDDRGARWMNIHASRCLWSGKVPRRSSCVIPGFRNSVLRSRSCSSGGPQRTNGGGARTGSECDTLAFGASDLRNSVGNKRSLLTALSAGITMNDSDHVRSHALSSGDVPAARLAGGRQRQSSFVHVSIGASGTLPWLRLGWIIGWTE